MNCRLDSKKPFLKGTQFTLNKKVFTVLNFVNCTPTLPEPFWDYTLKGDDKKDKEIHVDSNHLVKYYTLNEVKNL